MWMAVFTPSACRHDHVRSIRRALATFVSSTFVAGTLVLTAGITPVAATTVNDPLLNQQWGLAKVGAEQVWAISRGAGVTVAVIDSGSGPHPDLDANLLTGINLFGGANEQGAADVDNQGHGSHVAGIIAAVANNAIGVAGVAPEARILPLRVLGPDGRGRSGDVVNAIRMAADMGARVINLSLGGEQESAALNDAIVYASDKGSLVVAAAGNDGPTAAPKWPAAFDQTIAVSFVDQQNQPGAKSQVGAYIDIAAPGVGILSTALGDYGFSTGSSMAAAYVSGAAALLFAAQPSLTVGQVRDILLQSATDIASPGRDDQTGHGLLNLVGAFAQLAILFPDATKPVITSLGRVNEAVTVVARPDATLQWYRCTKAGQVMAKKPANCVAITNAILSSYRTKARDVGYFLRVAVRTPQTTTDTFSATSPRIMAKWQAVSTVTAGSVTPAATLLAGPSKGAVRLVVESGNCVIEKTGLRAPSTPETCVIRARISARPPFGAMNFVFPVTVTQ